MSVRGVTRNQNWRQRENSKLITLNRPYLDLEWMEVPTFILFGLLYLSTLTSGGSQKRNLITFIRSYWGRKTTLTTPEKRREITFQGPRVENYSTV